MNTYCIQGYECYDIPRAHDFMVAFTNDFFDILSEAYGSATWQREDEVADEAINIALKCWDNFNVDMDMPASFWKERLLKAIVQHLGRPLRSQRKQLALERPPTPSPLSLMAQAEANRKSIQNLKADITPPPSREMSELQKEVERRAALLGAYKQATGSSDYRIYNSQNSGIHKPQFFEWRDGRLAVDSKTTQTFEAFLRAKKPPIPRKSSS